jgi:hypothetical protein
MQVDYIAFRSKRRFGVEVEVNRHLSQRDLTDIVNTALGRGVCNYSGWNYTCNNDYWLIKPDSSCGQTGNRSDGGGYEVVSAVGHGIKHLEGIATVTTALKNKLAEVNKHCGLHCQVEIKDFSDKQAATLLAYWCRIEPLVADMVPQHRVRSNHCKLFTKDHKKWPIAKAQKSASDFWTVMRLRKLGASSKRNTITLVNYQRTNSASMDWEWFKRPTVELRLPESSLDAYNVKNWSRFFIHFVESCAKRPYPSTLSTATLEEFLQIVGLKSESDCCTVLSPGLFETKCWLLYRIAKYSRHKWFVKAAKRHWRGVSAPHMKWHFSFPKVAPLAEPIGSKGPELPPSELSESAKKLEGLFRAGAYQW